VSPPRTPPAVELEPALQAFFPGSSKSMCRLRRELRSVLHCRGPIIVAGERGSGKDHAARVIHHLLAGSDAPFIQVDPGGDFPSLPGPGSAYTLHLAGGPLPGGPPPAIREALRLVTGKGRLIISLTTPPEDDGRRPILPAGVPHNCPMIHLPPLRHRREDLPLLMGQLCLLHQSDGPLRLEPADLHHLYTHSWPGNLGELWAWMEEKLAPARAEGREVNAAAKAPLGKFLDREIDAWVGHLLEQHSSRTAGVLKKVVEKVERCVLKAVLDRNGGRQVESARILGINRNTLAHKIKQHGLSAHSRHRTQTAEHEPVRRTTSRRRT